MKYEYLVTFAEIGYGGPSDVARPLSWENPMAAPASDGAPWELVGSPTPIVYDATDNVRDSIMFVWRRAA
jgi:hypothetical protein